MTTGRTREPLRWDDAKIRRFADAWNSDVDAAILRDVYGRPAFRVASYLRKRGVTLKNRNTER